MGGSAPEVAMGEMAPETVGSEEGDPTPAPPRRLATGELRAADPPPPPSPASHGAGSTPEEAAWPTAGMQACDPVGVAPVEEGDETDEERERVKSIWRTRDASPATCRGLVRWTASSVRLAKRAPMFSSDMPAVSGTS